MVVATACVVRYYQQILKTKVHYLFPLHRQVLVTLWQDKLGCHNINSYLKVVLHSTSAQLMSHEPIESFQNIQHNLKIVDLVDQ